jgi:hypothetical protein
MDYERLIRQADEVPFEGWDFGVFRGRFVEAEPSWKFSKLLRTHMQRTSSMLDLGTGGGEFLSSLAPFDLAGYDEALRPARHDGERNPLEGQWPPIPGHRTKHVMGLQAGSGA